MAKQILYNNHIKKKLTAYNYENNLNQIIVIISIKL